MREYYLYRHVRQDTGMPFYIGIGTKIKRTVGFLTHKNEYQRAYNKFRRGNYWKNIVNKAGYDIEIIFESTSLDEIKNKEIEFIKLYKRKMDGGILINLTTGGEGGFGYIPTKEALEKQSKALSGKKWSKAHRDARLISTYKHLGAPKGRKLSEEAKKKISLVHKGKRSEAKRQAKLKFWANVDKEEMRWKIKEGHRKGKRKRQLLIFN